MKLTLAMGLQYDNGKQAGAVALSLGRALPQQGPIMEALVVELEQTHNNLIKEEPFFLTYNLKGLSDTLIFEQTLVDVFA